MPAHAERSGTEELHARLAARLRQQAEDVRRFTSGLDEEALACRPDPDKWSLKELVCHVWRVQEVFEMRIEAMLTETNPAILPYAPDNDQEFDEKMKSTCAELVDGFVAEREELSALVESLSLADWKHRGTHREYPHYDVQFAIEYLVHHEAHHLYQMLQRRALLGMPKP